jgi:hypothetical protein
MAKKPVKADSESDDSPSGKKRQQAKELLEEMREGYQKAVDADRENRDKYKEDMRFVFVPGEQWDDAIKTARGKDRVMYEFNELRVKVKNTINHIRSNRPSAKIRGTENDDVQKAEIYQGICLNAWNRSDGDSVTDYEAEHQVAGGMGAMRVTTQYVEDSVNDQDIGLEAIRNPMCLHADHGCQDEMKRDAKRWWLHSKLPKEDIEARYPNKEVVEFAPEDGQDYDDDDDGVWVCEYWKKVPVKKRLCLLSDGKTIDKATVTQLPAGVTILKERTVDSHKIVQYICSGDAILEGPNDWAGMHFPFVIVYGNFIVIDGKTHWYGLARHSKDAQRAHNVMATSVYETIASAPQAKYWTTAEQAKGNLGQWKEAIDKNLPAMMYNADPKAPGPPPRVGGADVPVALMQATVMSSEAIKATTGIFSNLDELENQTSGKAIQARSAERSIATYNYGDNMSKAVRRIYEIWIDLIPKVIDTPRTMRILGKDGSEKYVQVNTFDPVTGKVINDLSEGKMDVVVTQGPSFATQRMEMAETMIGLSQTDPTLMQIAGDLIVGSLDFPNAQAIADRKKAMLPPQIAAMMNSDKPPDPQALAMMQQAEAVMQNAQLMGQQVQEAAMQAATEKAGADKAKADVQTAIANLKTQEAQLATDVANFKTLVAQTQLKAQEQQSATEDNNEMDGLRNDIGAALVEIQDKATQMMAGYAQQMAQIVASIQQPQVIVANQPKQKQVVVEKVNGKYVGTMIEVPMQGPAN